MANIARSGPIPGLLIQLDPEDAQQFHQGLRYTGPQVPRAKIDHNRGVFLVPGADGETEEHEELHDLVVVEVKTGRIMWDPDQEPGSGSWVCRSSDGLTPDDGGEYPGPCNQCPQSKWGPKVGGKASPPECDETVTALILRLDGPPFLYQGARTALRPMQGFFHKNFVRTGAPYFTSYVSIFLEEHKKGSRTYYVPRFELGNGTEADVQKDAYELWKQAKEHFSAALDLSGDSGTDTDETEPVRGHQTVERTSRREAEPEPARTRREPEPTRRTRSEPAAEREEPRTRRVVEAEVEPLDPPNGRGAETPRTNPPRRGTFK